MAKLYFLQLSKTVLIFKYNMRKVWDMWHKMRDCTLKYKTVLYNMGQLFVYNNLILCQAYLIQNMVSYYLKQKLGRFLILIREII